jgi:hypothetical protein
MKHAVAFAALALASGACVLTDVSRERERRGAATTAPLGTHADVSGLGADTIGPTRLLFDDESSKMLYVGNDRGARPAMRRCNHDGTGCTAHFLDGGRGAFSGSATDAVIDHAGKKLVVAVIEGEWNSERVGLYRCGLDGAGCTHVDITGSAPGGHGARLVVDEPRGKLYATSCAGRPVVRACNVDGTGCTSATLDGSCVTSSIALDATNEKVLLVTKDASNDAIVLHRCARDLSECLTSDLGPGSYFGAGVAVDDASGRLFVTEGVGGEGAASVVLTRCTVEGRECVRRVFDDVAGEAEPHVIRGELVIRASVGTGATLLRCTLDGETCTAKSLGLGFYGGDYPSSAQVVYDAAHDMFLLPTRATGTDTPTLQSIGPIVMRQPRDGSAHHVHDISAGPGQMPYLGRHGGTGSSLLDPQSKKLYVLSQDDIRGISEDRRHHRVLSRCNADGTGCTFADAQNMVKLLGVVDGSLVSLGLLPEYPVLPGPENRALEILRCTADGTSCRHTEVLSSYGGPMGAVLDAQTRRALVLASTEVYANVYACPVHADTCAAPVALPMFLSSIGAIAFDEHRRKLLVLYYTAEGHRLARCASDGTGCTSTAVVSIADSSRARILVDQDGITMLSLGSPTDSGEYGAITVERCAADGTACKHTDVTYGGNTLVSFDATRDPSTNDLLIVVDASSRGRRATLLRCRADGSACTDRDFSAGQPAHSGQWPTALFDATTRTLLAVTDNATTARANLFTATLDDEPPSADAGVPPTSDGGGVRDAGSGPGQTPDSGGGSSGSRDGGGGKTW